MTQSLLFMNRNADAKREGSETTGGQGDQMMRTKAVKWLQLIGPYFARQQFVRFTQVSDDRVEVLTRAS